MAKKKTAVQSSKKTTSKRTAATAGAPKSGQVAPDFTIPDQHGHYVTLSKLKGSKVVLYFYPKDDTPGCTIEAKGFSDDYKSFLKKGVLVFGVSKDDGKSHCAFIDKYGLSFPLLSDTEGKVVKAYGAWVEKNMYGKKYMGIQRSTFLIGKDGKIEKVWPKVTPEGHSKEILKGL